VAIQNVELVDALGNPARVRAAEDAEGLIPLTLFAACRMVLWNMPGADLTIGDAELARNALAGMAEAEKNGNLWQADPQLHTWVVQQLRSYAPRVFGVNAICVVEAMAEESA
jgi:hypothetical protein